MISVAAGARPIRLCLLALIALLGPSVADAQEHIAQSLLKWADPKGPVFVVAHRGCHNAAPKHGLSHAPENSLEAMDHCVALGVDMMETDVRKSKDGQLVIIHDATVNRTTDGAGRVADLTLEDLRKLHIRENSGGHSYRKLTQAKVLTLDELLDHARGRILVNLDVKEEIYPEVVAAVEKAGMVRQVLIKREARPSDPPLASASPYDRVPFIPIFNCEPLGAACDQIDALLEKQASGGRRPQAAEMVFLSPAQMARAKAKAASLGIRLWGNTLTEVVAVDGLGGDQDALRDPDHWGRLLDTGLSIIQTDEPEALMAYLKARQH